MSAPRYGELVHGYLAAWLMTLAKEPHDVLAVVTEDGPAGTVIELQNGERVPTGGILFKNSRGMVHVVANVDPMGDGKHCLRWTSDDMRAVLEDATQRKHAEAKAWEDVHAWKTSAKLIILHLGALVILLVYFGRFR